MLPQMWMDRAVSTFESKRGQTIDFCPGISKTDKQIKESFVHWTCTGTCHGAKAVTGAVPDNDNYAGHDGLCLS